MIVGLPGVGLGGIFYLLSAVLMPIRELWRAVRGRASRASGILVVRQTAMAVAILGALWATGWLLGFVITETVHPSMFGARGGHTMAAVHNALRVGALVLSMMTLSLVLTTVHVARFFVRRGAARAALHGGAPVLLRAGGNLNEPAREQSLRVDSGTFGRVR